MKKNRMISLFIINILVIAMLSGCGQTDNYSVDRALLEKAEASGKSAKKLPGNEESESDQDDKDEPISEDEDTGLTEDIYKVDSGEVFEKMSEWEYCFSSGAGGWATDLFVDPDGSFHGSFHDSDMGDTGPDHENGTVYICVFSGHFDDYVRTGGPNIYVLNVKDIKYEKAPGTVEIEEGILYDYTEPYGLEGIENAEDGIVFMDAGAVTSAINDEQMSWISPLNFNTYVGHDFEFVEDTPEMLPFAVIMNTTEDYVFNGYNVSDKNQTFLENKVKLPGLENTESRLNEDGTYYYEDSDENGHFRVINTCFKLDEVYDCYNDADEFVPLCIEEIYGDLPTDELYPQGPKDSYGMEYDLVALNGRHSDYMLWSYGTGKNVKWCVGRFMCTPANDGDSSYAYAYIIETGEDDSAVPNYGFARFYASSLTFTGLTDGLSSAGEGKGAVKMVTADMEIPDGDKVKTREYIMVGFDDEELIDKYDLWDADFDDDYEVVIPEDSEKTYKLAEGDYTPFYVQYPSDGFHKLYHAWDIGDYLSSFGSTGMFLFLNEDDEVVYGYEVYTP